MPVREGFDHHQAVYEIVAVSLGLEVVDCQNSGLKLMVVPDVRTGFTSTEAGLEVQAGEVSTVSTIPMSVQQHPILGVGAQLEAALTAVTPAPRYGVTGIWVPFRRNPADRFSAYADHEHVNEVLG